MKAITLQEIYRMSKAHAGRFGWNSTNEDIRLVDPNKGRGVPALGDLGPEQWVELAAKWKLDMSGDGAQPIMPYVDFRDEVQKYRMRFGIDKTNTTLLRHGGSQYAPNIKHRLRREVADKLRQEIADDIQRARRVAGKADAFEPIRNQINVLQSALSQAQTTQLTAAVVKAVVPPAPSLPWYGAVSAEISTPTGLRDVLISFNSHVTLSNGKRGRVTSLRSASPSGPCTRMVVLMDDLTTRVLTHANVIPFYVIDVGPFDYLAHTVFDRIAWRVLVDLVNKDSRP